MIQFGEKAQYDGTINTSKESMNSDETYREWEPLNTGLEGRKVCLGQ